MSATPPLPILNPEDQPPPPPLPTTIPGKLVPTEEEISHAMEVLGSIPPPKA